MGKEVSEGVKVKKQGVLPDCLGNAGQLEDTCATVEEKG